jgi:periplasmic divalent cation tolerance protein
MATQYDLCFVTAGDRATADRLTAGLLRERLAACVTAVPGARSAYLWKGRVKQAREILLLIKTRRALRRGVTEFVKRHHPYEVPEVIFAAIDAGSRPYLDWLGESTAPKKLKSAPERK